MDKLSIVKIGGNIIEDNEQLGKFLTAFTKIEGGKVLGARWWKESHYSR